MRNAVNVGLFVSISSEHRRATFTCLTRYLVADKDSWESFSHIIRRGAEREGGRKEGRVRGREEGVRGGRGAAHLYRQQESRETTGTSWGGQG